MKNCYLLAKRIPQNPKLSVANSLFSDTEENREEGQGCPLWAVRFFCFLKPNQKEKRSIQKSPRIFSGALSLLMILGLVNIVPLAHAQSSQIIYDHRASGDRALEVEIGTFFPLFFQSFSGTYANTNLSVGGVLGLDVYSYLTNDWTLGGSIAGQFAFSPNGKMLLLLPMLVKGSYAIKLSPISLFAGVGAGISMTMLRISSHFDLVLSPFLKTNWNIDSTWSLGLEVSYTVFFQFYFGETAAQSRMGNFVPLALNVTYHF